MKIAFKDVDYFVKNPPKDVRAILIFGPDQGLVRDRSTALAKTAIADLNDPFSFVEMKAETLEKEPARLLDEVFALSFMGGRKVIRIPQAEDKITQACKALLKEETACDNLVLIEAGELGTKSPLRMLFEDGKIKNGVALACYAEEGKNLIATIKEYLTQHGYTASYDSLNYLERNIHGNSAVVRSELDKLMTYCGERKSITLEDTEACIENITDASFSLVCFSAAGGDIKTLDEKLSQAFHEGIYAPSLLRAMINHVKRLHKVKLLIENGMPAKEAMEKGIHPGVFWKEQAAFQQQMNTWSLKNLEALLIVLTQAEKQCKTTGIPAETLCSQTLLNIAKRAKR